MTLLFKNMTLPEIINHFARSEDGNERDLADVLGRHDSSLLDARNRIEELEQQSTGCCCCGDGVCECGEECEDHHCRTCTCFD